jgi:hypothetical protein
VSPGSVSDSTAAPFRASMSARAAGRCDGIRGF